MEQTICSKCLKEYDSSVNFCPHCGTKNKLADLTKAERFKIYLISVVFTPFGLYWFFKFFRSSNENKRKIARNVLIITIVTMLFAYVTISMYWNAMQDYFDVYENSLQIYNY